MNQTVASLVIGFNWVVLGYALVIALAQLVLLGAAATSLGRSLRRNPVSRTEDIFAHPGTPGLSVIVAAHNEEATIVECIRSVLAQRYPELELLVVEDGSTDATFARLRRPSTSSRWNARSPTTWPRWAPSTRCMRRAAAVRWWWCARRTPVGWPTRSTSA